MASTCRKIVSTTLTTNFREACKIVETKLPELGHSDVIVKSRFLGINATDVNVAAGRYSPGQQPPLETGLEGVGEIVAVGDKLSPELKGKSVGYIYNGTFSDYIKIPSKLLLPLPEQKAEYVPLLISGLTAAIALEKLGELKPKETVLITAAAGGTGHLAVQIAKQKGCHVIGLCSSVDKAEFLSGLGCDRVVNYKEEKLHDVLKNEYPRGLDVAYESIGGEVFEACLNRAAVGARIISLGFISSYHSPGGVDRSVKHATILQKLLFKSASVRGFFLMNHVKEYKPYFQSLVEMTDKGELRPHVEVFPRENEAAGLERVFDAVDYLYGRTSKGKIVVDLGENHGSKL